MRHRRRIKRAKEKYRVLGPLFMGKEGIDKKERAVLWQPSEWKFRRLFDFSYVKL